MDDWPLPMATSMQSIVTLTMNPSLDIAAETERIIPSEKLRCRTPRYDAGGGGVNVARAIKMLGGDALAIFPAGGPSGGTIMERLNNEAVRYRAVPIAGLTRECIHIDERSSGLQFRFVTPGPVLTAAEQDLCLDQIASLDPAPQYLVASGSLPLGVPDDFYARVVRLAKNMGSRIILDTSGDGLRQAGRGAFLIKPSLEELRELSGRPVDSNDEQQDAARSLIDEGRCEIVVLSLGGKGALLVTADAYRRFAPIDVAVRSTVGAGDSMVAGIVLSLARGLGIEDAVRFGIAAAAAALMHPGTQLCRREDAERFYVGTQDTTAASSELAPLRRTVPVVG